MKKIYLIILLLGIVECLNAQNIIQITQNDGSNNTTKTHENCGFKINGICSCEDIGGVDAEMFFNAGFYLKLTNYNQFPVTVLWKAEYNRGDDYKTGTTVIGAASTNKASSGTNNSEKIVKLHDGRLGRWSLVGIITRKLKN